MNRTKDVPTGQRLRVDPVACDGIGLCALLATRTVSLDRWGYPVIDSELDVSGLAQARAAVRACPHRALWVEPVGQR